MAHNCDNEALLAVRRATRASRSAVAEAGNLGNSEEMFQGLAKPGAFSRPGVGEGLAQGGDGAKTLPECYMDAAGKQGPGLSQVGKVLLGQAEEQGIEHIAGYHAPINSRDYKLVGKLKKISRDLTENEYPLANQFGLLVR